MCRKEIQGRKPTHYNNVFLWELVQFLETWPTSTRKHSSFLLLQQWELNSGEVQSESNKNLMMGECYEQTCSMRSNFLKISSRNIAKLLTEVEEQIMLSQAMVCMKGNQYRQGEDAASPWNTPQRWVPGNTWSLQLERNKKRWEEGQESSFKIKYILY